MIIDVDTPPQPPTHARAETWHDDCWFFIWIGALYLPGLAAGPPSVAALAKLLATHPLSRVCRQLCGVFTLFVHDKRDGSWQCAVDNAGLSHVFYSDSRLSTSFLEMIDTMGNRPVAFDPLAVAEFLTNGAVYWQQTFLPAIRKLRYDEVVRLGKLPDGSVEVSFAHKDLAEPEQPTEDSFLAHFEALTTALRDKRVSVDLTGGTDSRLVVALLTAQGLDFEIGTSGCPGMPDVEIPREAAQLLDRPFFAALHDVSTIENELPALFDQADGLCDITRYHRPAQLQAHRRDRGVDVIVTGHGGELYKDFWWLQDFPNYQSRQAKLPRLYDLRVAPISYPNRLLTANMQAIAPRVREVTLERFAELRRDLNTQTYDAIYYHYKMAEIAGGHLSHHAQHYLDVVTPLLDYRNYLFAYHLPRRERSFGRFHRKVITRISPQLAKLRTAEGMTASSAAGDVAHDLLVNVGNKLKRGTKKVVQRTLGQTWFQPGSNDPNLEEAIRKTAEFQNCAPHAPTGGGGARGG